MSWLRRIRRRIELTRSYKKLLAPAGNNPISRIAAHLPRLEEYWFRLIAASKIEGVTGESLVKNDLFLMVDIAAKATGEDVKRLSADKENLKTTWEGYMACFEHMGQHPQDLKNEIKVCYQKLCAFKTAFDAGCKSA